jgi:hypothetical protein
MSTVAAATQTADRTPMPRHLAALVEQLETQR